MANEYRETKLSSFHFKSYNLPRSKGKVHPQRGRPLSIYPLLAADFPNRACASGGLHTSLQSPTSRLTPTNTLDPIYNELQSNKQTTLSRASCSKIERSSIAHPPCISAPSTPKHQSPPSGASSKRTHSGSLQQQSPPQYTT